MRKHRVQSLLMGGQACILYGGAEFSRDIDFALLASPENLDNLQSALDDLEAEVIAVPPFRLEYLERGLAVHFRCHIAGAAGLRIDVMTKMRGVDDFSELWQRRVSLEFEDGGSCELMGLIDLVRAKKTQREKDWPMVRQLVEANYLEHREHPAASDLQFWLNELRTPALLIEAAQMHPSECQAALASRPLLKVAAIGDEKRLIEELLREELAEREADRLYWKPLRAELEQLRRDARKP